MNKYTKKILGIKIGLLALMVTAAGCGGAGVPTGSNSTPLPIELPSVRSISDLPHGVNPVIASASSNLSAVGSFGKATISQAEANASNGGILLGSLADETFTYGSSSYEACQVTEDVTVTLSDIGTVDAVVCVLQVIDAIDSDIMPVDNTFAYLNLTGLPSGANIPQKMKVRAMIGTNSEGADRLEEFEAFACFDDRDVLYTTQNINDAEVTINSVSQFNPDVFINTTVTGTLDSSLAYISKSVSREKVELDSGTAVAWEKHYLDYVDLDTVAYRYGYNNTDLGVIIRYTAQSDLIDYNSNLESASFDQDDYDIGDLAMSEGTINVVSAGVSGFVSGVSSWESTNPFALASSHRYQIEAEALTAPDVSTAPTVLTFTSAQSYDCTAESSSFRTIALTNAQADAVTECINKYIQLTERSVACENVTIEP